MLNNFILELQLLNFSNSICHIKTAFFSALDFSSTFSFTTLKQFLCPYVHILVPFHQCPLNVRQVQQTDADQNADRQTDRHTNLEQFPWPYVNMCAALSTSVPLISGKYVMDIHTDIHADRCADRRTYKP